MTPDEVVDYEYGRELRRLQDAGLVMEVLRPSGQSGWKLTLKGLREFGSDNRLRMTVREA